MYYEVSQAEYVKDYQISLVFNDGSTGVVNLASHANPDNVFKRFLDMNYFKDFSVEFGTLVWGKGELDIAPEQLYQLALRKKLVTPLK